MQETPPAPLRYILGAIFRSNPAYELMLFDRLPQHEQEAFAGLLKDPNLYGILRPLVPSLGIKSACRDTALLFFTLQVPGRLPVYVGSALGERANEAVAKLVLDQVLEIESGGAFLSGISAHRLVYEDKPSTCAGGTPVRLSIEALKYAQGLEVGESWKLSARLYCYNRYPASSYWKRKFPSEEAVVEYLELHREGCNRPLLDAHWARVRPSSGNNGWLSWESRYAREEVPSLSYKLYISPHCEHLRDAFRATAEVLSEVRAPSFKIGKDIYGILRPDKLVAYFARFDEVIEAAHRLQRRLKGMPAQGVPFTADIDEEGLLSWGMDPPRSECLLAWQGPSWRHWITDRLAVALLTAKAAPAQPLPPWRFALDRLRLEGIDIDSWAPAASIWDNTSGIK
jgi:hypothetical protein